MYLAMLCYAMLFSCVLCNAVLAMCVMCIKRVYFVFCFVLYYESVYIALACSLELVRCTLKILSPPDNRQHRQKCTECWCWFYIVYGFASLRALPVEYVYTEHRRHSQAHQNIRIYNLTSKRNFVYNIYIRCVFICVFHSVAFFCSFVALAIRCVLAFFCIRCYCFAICKMLWNVIVVAAVVGAVADD